MRRSRKRAARRPKGGAAARPAAAEPAAALADAGAADVGAAYAGAADAAAAGDAAPVMGWVEYVSFPEWRVEAVKAKVDTGARISALHVDRIRELGDGSIRFEVVLHPRQRHLRITAEAQVLRRTRIRSSNGVYQERYVVRTPVRIGAVERSIEVSLVSRPEMVFRMLLGRDAVGGFLVDAGRQYLLGGPRRPRRS